MLRININLKNQFQLVNLEESRRNILRDFFEINQDELNIIPARFKCTALKDLRNQKIICYFLIKFKIINLKIIYL